MDTIKEIKLSKDEFFVQFDNTSLKFAYELKDDKYIIDVTSLNLIKAIKLTILVSTYSFIKNFKKKLCWLVRDNEIKRAINVLRLSNTESIVFDKLKEERMLYIS